MLQMQKRLQSNIWIYLIWNKIVLCKMPGEKEKEKFHSWSIIKNQIIFQSNVGIIDSMANYHP